MHGAIGHIHFATFAFGDVDNDTKEVVCHAIVRDADSTPRAKVTDFTARPLDGVFLVVDFSSADGMLDRGRDVISNGLVHSPDKIG